MRAGKRRLVGGVAVALLASLGLFLAWTSTRGRAGDAPWAALDLGEAPGAFTGRKLVGLEGATCRALLTRAGVRFARVADRRDGPSCGYLGAIKLTGGSRRVALLPAEPVLSCRMAAASAMWEWSVVQPAARRYLGTAVRGIEHLGTYNCRPIAGTTRWSQHATANALDVAAFRLADGRRLSVLKDWKGNGPEATFLHQVRRGACPLFATVLSPDYNDAHQDHLHLDQAPRAPWGWRACR